MKVLILSCSTGGGHNSAAFAVAEEIRSHGDEAVVLDYLSLAGKKVSHIVGNSYIHIVKKSPVLWDSLSDRHAGQQACAKITGLLSER